MAQAHHPVFIKSGQFAVKPAIKEAAQALKRSRLPRQRELPLAKAVQPMGAGSRASNDLPARKGDRTRLQIKAAARVIFARDGFLNSTIAEIMKEAQRSIGVFYRYYKSKDELLLELTEEFRQKLLREIHLPLQPKQDPIENFEDKLGVFWQLYMEDWPIVNSALQMSMVDEAFAKRWHDLRQQGIGAIAHIIGKAKKLGYCPTIDPHYAASALCSMLEFTCYNWTSRWGDFAGAKMSKAAAIQTLKQIASHSIAWQSPM
jgi:AcrR family transcriptional regulator